MTYEKFVEVAEEYGWESKEAGTAFLELFGEILIRGEEKRG